jgi:putative ABC transport system substrate-binding protein
MTQEGANGLIVSHEAENITHRELIVQLTAQVRLPAIYSYPEMAQIGGLMGYGADPTELLRHSADQIDQIFKGAKPADMPFEQPTKFELALNLKTAKALGLAIPQSLLYRADEVIE